MQTAKRLEDTPTQTGVWAYSSRNNALSRGPPFLKCQRVSLSKGDRSSWPSWSHCAGDPGVWSEEEGDRGVGMGPGSGTGLRFAIRGEVAPQTFPAMQTSMDAAGQGAMQAGAQHRPCITGAESGAVVSEEVT